MCDVNYSIDHEEGEIQNYRRELDLEKVLQVLRLYIMEHSTECDV